MASSALKDDEITEYYDSNEKVQEQVKKLAELIKTSKHCVVYTGAGISTAAGISDFRGPTGVWTLKAKGIMSTAKNHVKMPTKTHMAIKELIDQGMVKYLVSQNTDGLHIKSGVTTTKIAELHGNRNKEYCSECKKLFYRDYATRNSKSVHDHKTGRKCTSCKGELFDSIINFGESLPETDLENAERNSTICDLAIVLGTSMRVQPACELPVTNKDSKLVICNLQKTPYDEDAEILIHTKTDSLMEMLFNELGLEIPEFKYKCQFNIVLDKVQNKIKFTDSSTNLKKLLTSATFVDAEKKKFVCEINTLTTQINKYKEGNVYTLTLVFNLLNPLTEEIKISKNCTINVTINTFNGAVNLEIE